MLINCLNTTIFTFKCLQNELKTNKSQLNWLTGWQVYWPVACPQAAVTNINKKNRNI